MAKGIPYIPELENVSDLLNILGSSRLFKERLEKLDEMTNYVNERLRLYEAHGTVEEARNAANALFQQAKQLRENADKYVAEKKAEGDALIKQASDQSLAILKGAKDQESALASREAAISAKEQELAALAKKIVEADKIKADAEATLESAKRMIGEAEKAKKTFEDKLKQINAIAA